MHPFNVRLPPLEHSVALQGFQTSKEEVLKVRYAWSIYIAMYISYSHVSTYITTGIANQLSIHENWRLSR